MKVFTLIIDHRYGTNIHNFLSESEMYVALYNYVRENWYEEDGNINDLSNEEAVDKYFHQNDWAEDWYQTDYTDFPVLSDLLTTLHAIHSAVLKLARERDPAQLGMWDAIFTPAKEVIARVEGRTDR